MKRLPTVSAILVMLAFSTLGAAATNDVFVKVKAGGGCGFTISRGSECFVLTAAHVVEDAKPGQIEIIGRLTRRAPARVERKYSGDLAILRVKGETGICGEDQWPHLKDLDATLDQFTEGILRSRTEDGGRQQISVYLTHWNDRFVTIAPKRSNDQLVQGLSGSALIVGGRPAGILLEVLAPAGDGKVFRLDRVAEIIASFLPPSGDIDTGSLAGEWNSYFGKVTLKQSGENVTGLLVYGPGPAEGLTASLEGTFQDGNLAFAWWLTFDPNGRQNPQGKGVLELSPDGRTLAGTFTDKNNPGELGHWVLSR